MKSIAAYTRKRFRLTPKFASCLGSTSRTPQAIYISTAWSRELNTAESVKRAADTALQLQPRLAEAQLAQGIYRYRVLRDFAGARQAFEAAARQAPNDQSAWNPWAWWSAGRASGGGPSSIWNKRRNSGRATAG